MSSNIQKAFKRKSELRAMADGGQVKPAPKPVAAAYSFRNRQAEIDAALADPAKKPAAQPEKPKTEAQKKRSALQNFFGLADGGDVEGPGGPTDDKVGPVMLSNGEYVLPADTVKAVGVENLDALRLATHDFKDAENRPKIPGRLRGMASGGVFYVDPEGNASRGALPGRGMVPAAAQRAPTAPAGPSFTSRAGAATRQAIGTGLRGVGALGAVSMAANGLMDEANAVRTGTGDVGRSAVNAGDTAAGLLGTAAALGARLNPVTSAAATGWMVGRAIGGMLPDSVNDSIGKGVDTLVRGAGKLVGQQWGTPDYAAPAAAKAPTAAPSRGATPVADVLGKPAMNSERPPTGPQYYADLERLNQQELAARAAGNREAGARMTAAGGPGAYYQGAMENRSGLANGDPRINGSTSAAYNALGDDAIVGSFKGRNITKKEADARAAGLQTASFMPQKPEPAEDPIMGEIRSALRNLGGGGGGSSFSGRGSGTDAINKRYDDLLRGGEGRNRVRGLDWSQRHGLSVEMARAKELGDYAQNQSTLRGQDMSAQTANLNARMSALSTMGTLEAQRRRDAAAAAADAAKAAADAAKADETRDERGLTDIREAVRARFGDDSALAESVLSRILSAGGDQIGAVTRLTGQERAKAIEDLLDSAVLAQQFDASQNPLWGATDAGLPRVGEVRDPRFFRDVGSGAAVLPALGREVKDFFGFDGRVMVDDNGRVAPYPGDLRLRRVARNAEADAPRRSRLRSERED